MSSERDKVIKESEDIPLCGVHSQLDKSGKLILPVINDCVACALNQRSEMLNLLATVGNTSIDVLDAIQELIDHAKQNAEKCDMDITVEDIRKVPSGDPAQWEIELRSLCHEIEKLPASEQQTAISVRASAIYQSLVEFNRYCDDQCEEMKKARPDLFGKQAEGGEE